MKAAKFRFIIRIAIFVTLILSLALPGSRAAQADAGDTPVPDIENARAIVTGLENNGGLTDYQLISLRRNLHSAIDAWNSGSYNDARSQMNGFINRVNWLIEKGYLPADTGQTLASLGADATASISRGLSPKTRDSYTPPDQPATRVKPERPSTVEAPATR